MYLPPTASAADRIISLRFWRRRLLICRPRRLHQLPDLRARSEPSLVLEQNLL